MTAGCGPSILDEAHRRDVDDLRASGEPIDGDELDCAAELPPLRPSADSCDNGSARGEAVPPHDRSRMQWIRGDTPFRPSAPRRVCPNLLHP